MVIQFVLNFMPAAIVGLIGYLIYLFAKRALPVDLKWVMEKTPLDAFLLFVFHTVILTSINCFINNLSKYVILSLDIICFFSALMLIMFHILSVSGYPCLKSI
jgi:hypothetical protein